MFLSPSFALILVPLCKLFLFRHLLLLYRLLSGSLQTLLFLSVRLTIQHLCTFQCFYPQLSPHELHLMRSTIIYFDAIKFSCFLSLRCALKFHSSKVNVMINSNPQPARRPLFRRTKNTFRTCPHLLKTARNSSSVQSKGMPLTNLGDKKLQFEVH